MHNSVKDRDKLNLKRAMTGEPWKVAFEEHFITPSFNSLPSGMSAQSVPKVHKQLLEVDERRIQLMDQAGIAYAILSLNSPGMQGEFSPEASIENSQRVNDELKSIVEIYPNRLGGFAALPTQDAEASAVELERCVKKLGFHGALINSFANDGPEKAIYLDDPRYDVLWDKAQELGVPIYLHPRNPLQSQQMMFEGHPELLAATWAFMVECSTHALRMITSGVFDRFPDLTICLGHLGEALPFTQWRVSKTYSQKVPNSKLEKTIYEYLKSNFVFTTSGFFDTKAMMDVADIMGIERVCFSSDHPWMQMTDGSEWFDNADIVDEQKWKIGRENAAKLFNLKL